jgi:hypothetical protein
VKQSNRKEPSITVVETIAESAQQEAQSLKRRALIAASPIRARRRRFDDPLSSKIGWWLVILAGIVIPLGALAAIILSLTR